MRPAIAAMLVSMLVSPLSGGEISYRDAALEAARWISSSAIPTEQGPVWPADPTDAKSVNDTLYSGTPGVILFFIEAFRSTGNPTFIKDARAGADRLLGIISNEKESGLYVGIAGIGFVLNETFKATGDSKYRDGAIHCAKLLGERAKKTGKGIEWNDTTDIIAGGAGIGLFLLYAAPPPKETASCGAGINRGPRIIH